MIKTRKAFGIWTAIPGYDGLLAALTARGSALPGARLDDGTKPAPDLDANVVAVGYDFRLGVASAAQELEEAIQPRLQHLWPKPEDRAHKVFFVTHSMGGLVARYWAARPDNRHLCRLIQMLGLALCPHILRLPLVAALSRDEVVASIGLTIPRYLTGCLGRNTPRQPH